MSRLQIIENVFLKSLQKVTWKSEDVAKRQTHTGGPKSASDPWPLLGCFLGRPGLTFSLFSIPCCIQQIINSFPIPIPITCFSKNDLSKNNPAKKHPCFSKNDPGKIKISHFSWTPPLLLLGPPFFRNSRRRSKIKSCQARIRTHNHLFTRQAH